MLPAKLIVGLLFFGIVASLASGLLFLVKDKGRSDRTVKALTVRIGVSVLLFAVLLALGAAGVLHPHGVAP